MTRDDVRALKNDLVSEMRETMAERVARRFTGFKYEPKEKKQNKVDRVMRFIREATGISRSVAEDIADAFVRGRDIPRLTIQKGWPVEDDAIVGPQGTLELSKVRSVL